MFQKKGVGTTRLYYNGSAAKSHSTTTQYCQLCRLYPHLNGDTLPVWNFCARFSEVILRGNQWLHCEMLAILSGELTSLHFPFQNLNWFRAEEKS